MNYIDNGYQH